MPCPIGSFNPNFGADQCQTCFETVFDGGTRCDALHCPSGWEFVPATNISNNECRPCTSGYYSNRSSSSPQIEDRTPCLICPDNTYNVLAASTTHFPCTAGLICDILVSAQSGWWAQLQHDGSLVTYACPPGYCDGADALWTNETVANASAKGHAPNPCSPNRSLAATNYLCGACEEGYVEFGNACVSCDGPNYLLIVGYVALSLVIVPILHVLSQSVSGAVQVFGYWIQSSVVQLQPLNQYLTWLALFNFRILASDSDSSCVYPLTPYQNFSMSPVIPCVLWVELMLLMVLHFGWWKHCSLQRHHHPSKRTEAHVDNEAGNVTVTVCVVSTQPQRESTDAVTRKRFGSLPTSSSGHDAFQWSAYVRTSIALALLSYQQISDAVISYLVCTVVGDGAAVVASHPSIQCNSEEYRRWLPLIYLLLVVVVCGFPICTWVLLRYFRQHIWTGDQATHAYLGTLFECYRAPVLGWSVVVLIRRVALIVLVNTIHQGNIVRHLTLVFFNLACLLLHLMVQPFRSREDNSLETFSLSCLLILSILIGFYPAPFPDAIAWLTSTMVLLAPMLLAAWIIRERIQRWRWQQMQKPPKDVQSATIQDHQPSSPPNNANNLAQTANRMSNNNTEEDAGKASLMKQSGCETMALSAHQQSNTSRRRMEEMAAATAVSPVPLSPTPNEQLLMGPLALPRLPPIDSLVGDHAAAMISVECTGVAASSKPLQETVITPVVHSSSAAPAPLPFHARAAALRALVKKLNDTLNRRQR